MLHQPSHTCCCIKEARGPSAHLSDVAREPLRWMLEASSGTRSRASHLGGGARGREGRVRVRTGLGGWLKLTCTGMALNFGCLFFFALPLVPADRPQGAVLSAARTCRGMAPLRRPAAPWRCPCARRGRPRPQGAAAARAGPRGRTPQPVCRGACCVCVVQLAKATVCVTTQGKVPATAAAAKRY